MLSLGNNDANNCVVYLENYLDCVENLPDDLQKHVSRVRELDVSYQSFLRDIESLAVQYDECVSLQKIEEISKLIRKVQSSLISAQELGDEKLQIIQTLQDLIDFKTRSLDIDYRNIDNGSRERDSISNSNSLSAISALSGNGNSDLNYKDQSTSASVSSNNGNGEQRQSKRVRRGRGDESVGTDYGSSSHHQHHHHYGEHSGSIPMPRVTATILINSQKKHNKDSNTGSGKKKKRKSNKQGKLSAAKEDDNRNSRNAIDDDDDQSIDPDEPRYCLCDQISYGEMIGCDNDLCPIEWFHFRCVSLTTKPKGKWFCPKCRGDRPNVMKPKAQFLKELERFNLEKEEKARSY